MVYKQKDTNKIALKVLQETSNDIIGKEYEISVFEQVFKRNFVICSDDKSHKHFIMLSLIKKFGETSKIKIVFYTEDNVCDDIKSTIQRHTNVDVKEFEYLNLESKLENCLLMIKFDKNNIAQYQNLLKLTDLLIITDCSNLFNDESDFTLFFKSVQHLVANIHIYGMNESLINKISYVNRVENEIPKLENLLNAHVDIGMVNMPRSNQSTLIEDDFVVFSNDEKPTKLELYIRSKLDETCNFLYDIESQLEDGNDSEVFDYCLKAILKCKSILDNLGIWCCCVVARAFMRHFMRLIVNRKTIIKPDDLAETDTSSNCTLEDFMGRILMNCCSVLTEIVRVSTATFDKMVDLEEFQCVMSDKVANLIKIIKRYKSSLNFKIEAIKLPTSSKETQPVDRKVNKSSDYEREDQFSELDYSHKESSECGGSITDIDGDDDLMSTTDDNDDGIDVLTDDESNIVDRGGPTFKMKPNCQNSKTNMSKSLKNKKRKKKLMNSKVSEHNQSKNTQNSSKNQDQESSSSISNKISLEDTTNFPGCNRFLFRAVIPSDSNENFEKMSCIIYVNCSFSSYALSKFIEELCSWDADLFFVRPAHVFDSNMTDDAKDKSKLLSSSQEEILSQFRRNQVNCLVATKVINSLQFKLPISNLIIRFDDVSGLMEYFHCKSKVGTLSTSTVNLLRRTNCSVADAISSRTGFMDNSNKYSLCKLGHNGLKIVHLVREDCEESMRNRIAEFKKIEEELQNRYYKLTNQEKFSREDLGFDQSSEEIDLLEEKLSGPNCQSDITFSNVISYLNLYCARLPTDIFTRLTPNVIIETRFIQQTEELDKPKKQFKCTITLPINSPYRLTVSGNWMSTVRLSKMSTAHATLQQLYSLNELDSNYLPWNKEDNREIGDTNNYASMEDEYKSEKEKIAQKYSIENYNEILLGSNKRRICYDKGFAKCISTNPINPNVPCYLYSIDIFLSRAKPEKQNLKGRKLMVSQEEPRYFGLISGNRGLEKTLIFPVFTRSGEEEVSINPEKPINQATNNHSSESKDEYQWVFTEEELDKIIRYHEIMFLSVFRLKIDKTMKFDLQNAHIKLLLVPLNKEIPNLIDWEFLNKILDSYYAKENVCRLPFRRQKNGDFEFNENDYKNAVVMPNYRNMDYRQYYYVADICYNMHPTSDFPGENFSTFAEYYQKKYNAQISNYQQPLLDADFSVMRLNMCTPRHVNFKGIPLPLPSDAKKKSLRESIHQKQFLIPELCFIHPFPATLWHKATCLPTIMHRINQLLMATELRNWISLEIGFCCHSNQLSMLTSFSSNNNNSSDTIRHKLELDYNLDGGYKTDGIIVSSVNTNNATNAKTQTSNFREVSEQKRSDTDFGIFKADEFLGENEQDYLESLSDVESNDSFDNESPPEFHPLHDELMCCCSEEYTNLTDENGDNPHANHIEMHICNQPGPHKVLESIMMLCAADFINLERLETVGDSFLKYASTVYNFLRHPAAHEGRLSYLRCFQVSNLNLFQKAVDKKLYLYIHSQKFAPNENWMLPGWVSCLNNEASTNSEKTGISNSNVFMKTQHYLSDKNLADMVEALIGCYLTTRGEVSTLRLLKWLDIDCIPLPSDRDSDYDDSRMVESDDRVYCKESPRNWIKPRSPIQIPMMNDQDRTEFNEMISDLRGLEKIIDYEFKDKAYLLQAMTHSSYNQNRFTDCYQRLEFLGDAVLDYVITRCLYSNCINHSPGELTDLRSALVNNNIFSALVVKFDIYKYFKCSSPKLWAIIDNFVVFQKTKHKDNLDYIIRHASEDSVASSNSRSNSDKKQVSFSNSSSKGSVSQNKEGYKPQSSGEPGMEDEEIEFPKCLGDIFESLAGAVFIDSGMNLNVVWRVFYPLFKERIKCYTTSIPKSPVRRLLELLPEIVNFESQQRTTNGKHRVCVRVIGKGRFYGVGRNYRIAKSVAAKKALKTLLKDDSERTI